MSDSRLPHIEDTGGEVRHTFRFWVLDSQTGARVPMTLCVDKAFTAVGLRIDTGRDIQPNYARPVMPGKPLSGNVIVNGKKATVVSVSPELAAAHMKLCAGRRLEDPEAEKVRQQYLAEMAVLTEDPNCPGCVRGALTRKYQKKMLSFIVAGATS